MVYTARERQFYDDLKRVITLAKRGTRSPGLKKELDEIKERMSSTFHNQAFTYIYDFD